MPATLIAGLPIYADKISSKNAKKKYIMKLFGFCLDN